MTKTQPNQDKPVFNDILSLIHETREYPTFTPDTSDALTWLQGWLGTYSRIMDFTRGFEVNRAALYWGGYDVADGFDGQGFVDACQDSKGSLRQLAQILDTDLQIFELDPHNTTATRTADEIAMAASYGMMAIEESTQLFCACAFGQGVEATAQKALNALNTMTDTTDFDLESFLMDHSGIDIAAMMGAAIAGSMKGIPVILDGTAGLLVQKLLETVTNRPWNHLITPKSLSLPLNQPIPGQAMLMSAIMMKTIYNANPRTDCGKLKLA